MPAPGSAGGEFGLFIRSREREHVACRFADLDFTPVDQILAGGLHGYLDGLQIKINVNSLMVIFSQKVPSQIIEPGSRFVAWAASTTPNYIGTSTGTGSYAWFEANFSGGTPPDDTLREGWGTFTVAGIGNPDAS